MYSKLIFTTLLSVLTKAVIAQSISGSVQAPNTSISLVNLYSCKDSSLVAGTYSDSTGAFSFAKVDTGCYYLTAISEAGKSPAYPIAYTGTSITNIVLNITASELSTVTVAAKKPFIKVANGKTIISVEDMPSLMGASVLDMLAKLPGVRVSTEGLISMNGKSGVLVLINNRETYLTGTDLAAYLRTIQPEEVKTVEIITQPDASYAASGNMGIINITTKKNRRRGWYAAFNATVGQNVYHYHRSSANISYNHQKWSFNLLATEHLGNGFAALQQHQIANGTESQIQSHPVESFSTQTLQLLVAHNTSSKFSWQASCRGSYHPNEMRNFITNNSTNSSTQFVNYQTIPEGFIRKDIFSNMQATYKPDSTQNLSFSADHLSFSNNTNQDISSYNYDTLANPIANPLLLKSKQPTQTIVYSAKVDYTNNFKNWELSLGARSSFVKNDHESNFKTNYNGNWITDTTRTNHFLYTENINAAYININKSWNNKWQTTLGLRAENTNAYGKQYNNNSTFTKNYINLFPTLFLGYQINANHRIELNSGRRIDRPEYKLLNPFIYYSFRYSYYTGNPNLNPQFTYNTELRYSYKNQIFISLSYDATSQMIGDVFLTDSKGQFYQSSQNINSSNTTAINLTYYKNLNNKITITTTAYGSYNAYKALINNENITTSGNALYLNGAVQWKINEQWGADCNINYSPISNAGLFVNRLSDVFFSGGIEYKPSSALQLRLFFNDPLYTYRFRVYNNYPGYSSTAVYRHATQDIAISLAYSFGKNKALTSRLEKPDETKRMKTD